MLKFDEGRADPVLQPNLKTLYGVAQAPCDTQLRALLDRVDPLALQPVFRLLQRHKGWGGYRFLGAHYLVSLDGTGHFASNVVSCPECCIKHRKKGDEYYHQVVAAVLVHPKQKTVLPLGVEAITRQDGTTKHDCERNASHRLLTRLREDFPQTPMIILEDSLASNGSPIKLLQELDLRFIIGVKEGDHQHLFQHIDQHLQANTCQEWSDKDDQGTEHGYRFIADLPLNASHSDVRVNYLEHWIIKQKTTLFSWVTDLALTQDTLQPIARGGRARWKVENETFNTLKNQGYELAHNYGHGQQHLATVYS